MRRLGSIVLGIALAALVAGGAWWLKGSDDTSAAANRYTAYVGNGARGIAVSQFMPSSLVVNEGDTINWTNPYAEPHTVSFNADNPAPTDTMAPLGDKSPKFDGTQPFSSGFLRRGDSFEVTFTKAGAYSAAMPDPRWPGGGRHRDLRPACTCRPRPRRFDAQAKAQLEAALPIGDRMLPGYRGANTKTSKRRRRDDLDDPGCTFAEHQRRLRDD